MGNLCNMGKVYVRFFVVGLRSSVSVILLEPLWGTMEVRAYNLRVRGEPPWTDTQQHPTSAAERFSPRPARSWSAPRWVDSRPGVKRHSGIQSEAVSCNLARAAIQVALTRTVIINCIPAIRRRSCT